MTSLLRRAEAKEITMYTPAAESLSPVPSVSPSLPVAQNICRSTAPVFEGVASGYAPVSGAEPLRDRLVLENLPVVRLIARKLQRRMPQHIDLEDLVSAGTLGLMDAATRFDGTKEVQFRSYAQFRIRGAMLDSLRESDWSPRDLRRKSRVMAEAIRALSSRLGRAPKDDEIAAEMGLTLQAYQELTGDLKGLSVSSLNVERGEESDEQELDFLEAPASEGPIAMCLQGEQQQQLAAAISELPEKERLVLTLYYHEGLTMKEIGLVLGVVESRVSQLRAAALGRLRKRLGAARRQSGPTVKPQKICAKKI